MRGRRLSFLALIATIALAAGVTAAFGTNPVPGSSSNVTFTASPTAQPGTFNTILIRGTAAGLTDVTAAGLYNKTGPASTVYAYGWPSAAPSAPPTSITFFTPSMTRTGSAAGP